MILSGSPVRCIQAHRGVGTTPIETTVLVDASICPRL